MRILVDTNILVRIADSLHASHQLAADAVQTLANDRHELVLVPQLIYEFWSVATRSTTSNGLGKSPAYAESLIPQFCRVFRLLRDERSIYETWLQLVTQYQVCGVKSHDTRLAAAMLRHDITHLLSFNASDFRRYPHVSGLEPEKIMAPPDLN